MSHQIDKPFRAFLCAALLALAGACARAAAPIQLHPDHPHYFLWRGRPTILIASGEHYGAVLNCAFNYRKYLATLESLGFNLTRTLSVSHEDGTGQINAPGGGGAVLHKQLRILSDFTNSFDFVRMTPDNSVVKGGVPDNATARALSQKGRAYAIYTNGGSEANLVVEMPPSKYTVEWVNTKTGETDKKKTFDHAGGSRTLKSPQYEDDIALRIVRSD